MFILYLTTCSPAYCKIKLHQTICGGNVLSLWSFFLRITHYLRFFCSFFLKFPFVKWKVFFYFTGFLLPFSFSLMNYILQFFLIKLHWAKKVRAGGGPGLRAPPSPWWFFELSTRVPLVDFILITHFTIAFNCSCVLLYVCVCVFCVCILFLHYN